MVDQYNTELWDRSDLIRKCEMLPHLESKGTTLLSNFLQEGFLNWWFCSVSICRWIHLNTLYPNVSSEGEPNYIQVFTSIAEGASKVDIYCNRKGDNLEYESLSMYPANSETVSFSTVSKWGKNTFSAIKTSRVHFNHTICKWTEGQH